MITEEICCHFRLQQQLRFVSGGLFRLEQIIDNYGFMTDGATEIKIS